LHFRSYSEALEQALQVGSLAPLEISNRLGLRSVRLNAYRTDVRLGTAVRTATPIGTRKVGTAIADDLPFFPAGRELQAAKVASKTSPASVSV
jgi:hypothetical protein